MERELIVKLNEIRKELEISKEDFVTIMSLAEKRRKNSSIRISDEMLYEIIVTALSDYDYGTYSTKKTPEYLIERAIKSLVF